ncbi:hypothetical protein P7C70_g4084, partial [Phenoliferia sp. Uapishka_3]
MGKRTAPETTSTSKRPRTSKSSAISVAQAASQEETVHKSKGKGKAVAQPVEPEVEEEDEEEDEDEDGEEDGSASGSSGWEEDSEANEFEQMGSDAGDSLIGDDDEDLMAAIDGSGDEEDSGDDPMADAPAPVALKKANIRNSRQKAPLKPAELRALAFAELTASPISGFISTQVITILPPLSPPAPATSPLQPLLKSLHAHITSLPSQKPISLAGMKKKGIVVPQVEGVNGKWGEMDFAWEKPKPEEVRIVGRWAWGGGMKVKGEYIVDMAIAMPSSLLQPKDYLSPRFLIKSTHYLTTLASHLPITLGPITLSYAPLPSLGYALEIRSAPVDTSDTKVGLSKIKGAVIRIRILAPSSLFPRSKLSPLSNLSRPSSATTDVIP